MRSDLILNCVKKRVFADRAEAEKHLAKHGQARNLKAYVCPICGKWHVSTRNR